MPSYDDAGRSTYNPANHNELTNVHGYRTFRQVAEVGSFEGETATQTDGSSADRQQRSARATVR